VNFEQFFAAELISVFIADRHIHRLLLNTGKGSRIKRDFNAQRDIIERPQTKAPTIKNAKDSAP